MRLLIIAVTIPLFLVAQQSCVTFNESGRFEKICHPGVVEKVTTYARLDSTELVWKFFDKTTWEARAETAGGVSVDYPGKTFDPVCMTPDPAYVVPNRFNLTAERKACAPRLIFTSLEDFKAWIKKQYLVKEMVQRIELFRQPIER